MGRSLGSPQWCSLGSLLHFVRGCSSLWRASSHTAYRSIASVTAHSKVHVLICSLTPALITKCVSHCFEKAAYMRCRPLFMESTPSTTHSDKSPQNASKHSQTPHGRRLGRCHTSPGWGTTAKVLLEASLENKLFSDILRIEWREDKVQVQLPSGWVGGMVGRERGPE